MDEIFRFPTARVDDPQVAEWFESNEPLRGAVRLWYIRIKQAGPGIRELIHDNRPTLCVDNAAFAYVDTYSQHANIGFFFGSVLDDPFGLLEGNGKRMRHVKLQLNRMPDKVALTKLISCAYHDMRRRLADN